MLTIYTDGSCAKGRSGWGYVILRDGEKVKCGAGQKSGATNQCMELTAAIEACHEADLIREKGEPIVVYSDSAYLINCVNDRWYLNWETNGWVNSKKEPVANKELWEELIPYFRCVTFSFEKVKGHAGHTYNELADRLARGLESPARDADLTTDQKNDTIIIELSELLIKYKMNLTSTQETISTIMRIMAREGAKISG